MNLTRRAGCPGPCVTRRFGMAAALLLLSACSILPATEDLEIYPLPAGPAPGWSGHPSGDPLPWTLRLATPNSSHMTDSPRILALRQGGQLSPYKGIRWSDPAPVLLRNRLAAAFRAEGGFSSVSNGGSTLAHLELGGDLSAFQVEYADGWPQATIRFYATLSQPLRNRIVAARSFEISEPVRNGGPAEIIAAFGLAADRLATQITDWTVRQGMALQAGGGVTP